MSAFTPGTQLEDEEDRLMRRERLLAAALDMLAALQNTLAYWEMTGFAECDEGCDCIVQAVRAALAKAEGA